MSSLPRCSDCGRRYLEPHRCEIADIEADIERLYTRIDLIRAHAQAGG